MEWKKKLIEIKSDFNTYNLYFIHLNQSIHTLIRIW